MKVQNGDSAILSWVAPFFPSADGYHIYHTDKTSNNKEILTIKSDTGPQSSTNYEYHSRPYNSTNITFGIKNVTLEDAGYYNGGTQSDKATSCGGVVLIVYGESIQTINNLKKMRKRQKNGQKSYFFLNHKSEMKEIELLQT